jgi:ATP:ADP antiporter, AAA family
MSELRHRGTAAVVAMMALYFLVLLAVGMLRPIRNALALDGLGQTDFYKVYLVSAFVVLFVPLLNRLAASVPWRRLIPAIAIFFALNLFAFRALYVDGSTVFGFVFYGWYDLFAAGLVTQLFIVTQLFFHARLARNAYPLVITGGALGASAGGAVTGFLAQQLGTPNLLLVAGIIVAVFAVALTAVWSIPGMAPTDQKRRRQVPKNVGPAPGLRAVFADRQVQLIMALVLVTILVKQLVDYQFNTITKEVFIDRDAISAFQGKVSAATQWLPIVVLAALRNPLKRWGVGAVVLILPVAMFLTNVGLLLFWGLWAAVSARVLESSLRYSAERTGREILYVPVRDEIKLRAKAYIDVAVEKGVGKVISALVIFVLLTMIEYRYVALIGVALSLAWIVMALAVRREYVRSLAAAVKHRVASLHGTFASLADANTSPLVRDALAGDDRQVGFALELIGQAQPEDALSFAPELRRLLGHSRADIRRRALDLLTRVPEAVDPDTISPLILDPEAEVREAAVRAMVASDSDPQRSRLRALLSSPERAARVAALTCLARGELTLPGDELVTGPALVQVSDPGGPVWQASDAAEVRAERVLAAAAFRPPEAATIVRFGLQDEDASVALAAVHSAGLLADPALHQPLVAALGRRSLRSAARESLAAQREAVVPLLADGLLDAARSRIVRRQIPSVLARIPSPATIEVLTRSVLSSETDQILDHRAIKALSKIRARRPDLEFATEHTDRLLSHLLDAAARYVRARNAQQRRGVDTPRARLLHQALGEAWAERREEVFRCLGLRYAAPDVYRCYLAVVRGETVPQANALEWLENTVGFRRFRQLAPVLGGGADPGAQPGDFEPLLHSLVVDEDRWLAAAALAAARELGLSVPHGHRDGADDVEVVERVLLLQRIDVLADARSSHLALVAEVANELEVEADTVLIEPGQPPSGLFIVVSGEVTVTGAGGRLSFTDGMAFGAWSLIDAMPSIVEARAVTRSRLLHVDREDFYDLLSDYPELAIGLLQGLARRVRALAA